MNAVIGTYDNLDKAMSAVKELVEAGYPRLNLSLAGKMHYETYDKHSRADATITINQTEAARAIGKTMTVLNKSAVFAVPELGHLFAAGALISYVANYVRNNAEAGLGSILESLGFDEVIAFDYAQSIEAGKFMVIAHGTHNEIAKAGEILEKHITYAEAEGDKVSQFDLGKWLKSLNTDFPLAG